MSDRGVFRLKNWESIDLVDDAKVATIARLTAEARVFTTPTLTMFKLAFAEAIAARERAMVTALNEGQPVTQVMGKSYETMLKR